MQEALTKREEVVSTKEEAMLSKVQEQKDCAIASLFQKKFKWQEEKNHLKVEATSGKYPQQDNEVATTMKLELVHCAFIVPNGPTTPPSQAIKVDATTSKLVGNNNLTPSFEVVTIPSMSIIITNKQDTTNQYNNMAPMGCHQF
jgi:hypothetical protein